MNRRCLALALAAALACTKKGPAAPAAGAQDPVARESDAGAEGLPAEDEVKPVYAEFAGPALPLAEKLCGALYDLPEVRRSTCCSGQPGHSFVTTECTRIVSAALRSGAVALDSAAVEACVAAQAKAYAGCGWVGQWLMPLPPGCDGLLQGHRKSGEVCRSSLECGEGLHCLGVGPTDPGRCGPPRSDGQACLTAVDPLASYTRESEDTHHQECAGFCGHRRCEPRAAPGGKCFLARECSPGQHCDGEKCVKGALAAAGEKCVGDACVAGLRCITGKCAEPKAEGAACKTDYECLGGCVPKTNLCGMRCDVR